MENQNIISELIKEKIGLKMARSNDFDVLAQAIKDATGENLGVNTLKRFFGYNSKVVEPRSSTLDVIAQYLDYPDYETLAKTISEDSDFSSFTDIECIEVQDLKADSVVRISYDPKRVMTLKYIGDFKFVVNETVGSRNIHKGDVLTITQLAVGHRLVAAHIYRDGQDLGAYESARHNGLRAVEIIE